MANSHSTTLDRPAVAGNLLSSNRARQARYLLQFVFIVAPILAGIDKFFHALVDWDMYLAPWIARLSPIGVHPLMMVAGGLEIIAGLIVAFVPKVGGWIVCIWLWLIVVNLLTFPGFYDIALRDFGLSLAALALARLSLDY